MSRDDRESRFTIFLPRILRKMRLASHENISASLASLTRREKCDILCNLRDSQTSKIIIHSEKLVLDPKFSQGSRVKISNDSCESYYKISVCKTCESRCKIYLWDLPVSLRNLCVRLARSESCYEISFCETRKKRSSRQNFIAKLASCDSHNEISVCETREKRVSLLILTYESRENFES